MWKSRPPFGEIPKGLVGSVGSLLLAFHAFHSPAISTAPPSLQVPGWLFHRAPIRRSRTTRVNWDIQLSPDSLPTDSAIEPKNEVPGAAIFVDDVGAVTADLATELAAVAAMHPTRAVAPLEQAPCPASAIPSRPTASACTTTAKLARQLRNRVSELTKPA
jgi:hypothetical protein